MNNRKAKNSRLNINLKKVKVFLMLVIFCSIAGPVFPEITSLGYKESPSYIITSDNLASMNDEGLSNAYKLTGVLQENDLGQFYGSSYDIWQGFLNMSVSGQTVTVTSITPNSGYNTGSLSVSLVGTNFFSGASVSLTKSGETAISATGVIVSSASEILCNFDLTGKTTGNWNIVVTNIDNTSGTLTDGFTMKTLATAGLLYNSPNPFNPANGPTTIIYTLASNADTSLLIFNISGELIFKGNYSSGSNGAKAGDNSVTWNGTSSFGELLPNGLYFCRVSEKATGKVLAKGRIAISR